MAARSMLSGTISFGLVSIPVKFYTATSDHGVHFNLLHAQCGSPINQKRHCAPCAKDLQPEDIVKGLEIEKNKYVRFTDDELKAMEAESSRTIEIAEFAPLSEVDPVYFDQGYVLGADEGGSRAYKLLADALSKAGKVALAKFVMRGKDRFVLLRPAMGGIMLHTMCFADEIRTDFVGIDRGESVKTSQQELMLATQLVAQLSSDEFTPEKFKDEYTARVEEAADKKAKGKHVVVAAPGRQPAKVVDLMDALRGSIGAKKGATAAKVAKAEPARTRRAR